MALVLDEIMVVRTCGPSWEQKVDALLFAPPGRDGLHPLLTDRAAAHLFSPIASRVRQPVVSSLGVALGEAVFHTWILSCSIKFCTRIASLGVR